MRWFFALLICLACMPFPAIAAEPFNVTIQIDAARKLGELPPIWRFFGADEPNYATMPHGEKLLGELGDLLPQQVFFRAHNLLTSGDGTPALKWGSTNAYTENEHGAPIYDWTILDAIFDAYLKHHVRPYVQIGFMPEALSIHSEPYRHHWGSRDRYGDIFTGWSYPPKSYDRWGELVYQWAKHCVDRYGTDEVATWYWETWNEANTGYWRGTREEFFKLHDYAIAGVRRALPRAKVGGADSAGSGGEFTRAFFEHCLRGQNLAAGEKCTPLDFVSFHAKGAPQNVDGHVRMGIAEQLRTIDDGFRIVATFPELKGTPIIIGESDPEGCAACQGPQLAYRNGTMYSSYTAAVFARKYELAARHGVNLEGALTWAFEFENQPLFAGFRSLATGGIDKPVLNVFRMFSLMQGQRIEATSDAQVPLDEIMQHGVRERPDVGVLATRQGDTLSILVWHYHDDDLPGPAANIRLVISDYLPAGEPEKRMVQHYRVDRKHSNAFEVWKEQGSPVRPTAVQYAELERAMKLAEFSGPMTLKTEDGANFVEFSLPRGAVSLVRVGDTRVE